MKKRFLSLILTICLTTSICAFMPLTVSAATSGTCGNNLTWTLDDEGTLTISGNGTMPNYYVQHSPFYNNDNIKSVIIENGITNIGVRAFKDCHNLTDVTIPDSVTSIGSASFYACGSLTSMSIGNGLTNIGNEAFDWCDNIESVYITDLAAWCNISYEDCYDSVLNGSNLYVNNELVTELIIPDGVVNIGTGAFFGYNNLVSVTIPNSVTSIGSQAFRGCDGLTRVTIGNSVVNIDRLAFEGDCNLESVYITDLEAYLNIKFEYADSNPMYYADKLYLNNREVSGEVIIPNNVTYIPVYAFEGCESITAVKIPNSVTGIDGQAFGGCINLTSVTIPDSVTMIGYDAFNGCKNLIHVVIPESVTNINYPFPDCDRLESAGPIGGGYNYEFGWTNSIPARAFMRSKLTSVTIPDSVTKIGFEAFYECDNLTDVYYTGSESDWEKIIIDECYGENAALRNATIHYNYKPDKPTEPSYPDAVEFVVRNNYCVENEKNYIFGNVSISENNQTIDDVTSKITWKSSDTSIAEVGNVSYTNSEDEKSALIDVEIIGHKIGKATITGTTADGRTAEAVVSVEPKLQSLNHGTIFSPTTIKYKISTESDNKEYFEEFVSSLNYDISAINSVGISVDSTEYIISSNGKNAVYIINVTPTLNLTDNIIKLQSAYGQSADIKVRVQKKNGFSIKNDGWSFANSEFSFSGKYTSENIYTMPLEIYDQVYGSAYINANNITTGETFGGYCEGMSDTAILFYDELLKWYDINNLYNESFNTVNSYYDGINYYKTNPIIGDTYYFVTSNPSSEVTRLIECYQLWGNHVGRKCVSSTFLDVFETYCNGNTTNNNYEYLHYENGGTYVEDVLNKIKQAVTDDTPLLVTLQYQAGGHAIVARTDKMPEEEGNGWWKVFVYDPNKPYINDDILNTISNENSQYELLQSSCNELLNNGDDNYMELNPSKNLWRYHTSLTSGSTEDLIGCDENENFKIMVRGSETEPEYLPEYFFVQNPKEYFAGTFENPNRSWLPSENENTITIQLTDGSSFEIYSLDHVLLAKAAKGYGISYDDDIYFLPYVNSDSTQCGTTGELVIPKDKYQIEVNNGNLRIWGHDNVISLDASAGVSATLDIEKNKIDLTSNDNINIVLLMSNVGDADEYDTYKLTGELKESDNISAELPDGKPLQTESNTKDVVSVYHNSDKQDNETYEYTIGEASKSTHSGGSGSSSYIIKFNSNGGSTVANQTVKKNSIATKPADPTKEGYVFGGWYTDKELITTYDFSEKVINNVSLYAKWVEIETENETIEWKNPFNDVKKDDWFYANVKYVYENGLMNGTTETTFAPNDHLTRAMLVTILYRAEGEPEVNNSIPFEDVTADSYYAKAVIWAQQNGIISGVSENEFAPDENITREQIAAIMYRYAQYKGYDVSVGENTNILSYDDFDSVSEYAISAMQYAVGSGLIKGKSESTLNPQDNATRAEIATILQRFIETNK